MRNRFFSSFAAILVLCALSSGCDGPPVQPTPPPVFTVSPTFTVSGEVTEMTDDGPAPVEGVIVNELANHLSATTDTNGDYTIKGMRVTDTVLSTHKAGYVTESRPLSARADTRLDIRVGRVRTYPTSTLSGLVYEVVAGVRVPDRRGADLYCDGCGSPVGHTFVDTDADGLYSLSWVLPGVTYLQVIGKAGFRYQGPIHSLGIPITITGDTKFDIELIRR